LPGARGLIGSRIDQPEVNPQTMAALSGRYGARARDVLEIASHNRALLAPLAPGAFAIGAEVIFAVRYEMARTVSDLLVRRTAMVWRNPIAAMAAAPRVARLMAQELDWPRAREENELAQFRALYSVNMPAPRAISV